LKPPLLVGEPEGKLPCEDVNQPLPESLAVEGKTRKEKWPQNPVEPNPKGVKKLPRKVPSKRYRPNFKWGKNPFSGQAFSGKKVTPPSSLEGKEVTTSYKPLPLFHPRCLC